MARMSGSCVDVGEQALGGPAQAPQDPHAQLMGPHLDCVWGTGRVTSRLIEPLIVRQEHLDSGIELSPLRD